MTTMLPECVVFIISDGKLGNDNLMNLWYNALTLTMLRLLPRPSQWGWANFNPPQLRNRLTDFDEIRNLELSSEDHPPRKISFRCDDVGGLGE